jgi:hypothetical protein
MTWQDAVLAAGSIVFAIALIPSLRSASKPHLNTSLITGAVLAAYVLTFATLGLWFAAATDALVSAMWFALAWQRARDLAE